ncbi:MAG: hypothetical protein M3433_05920 [Actinomycetota bacterium]|nr:hypothetical protein [Actinomycetota bacterium]
MTVATNALLEGRGARTAFLATEGFVDIVALGARRARTSTACKPPIPRRCRTTATARRTSTSPRPRSPRSLPSRRK